MYMHWSVLQEATYSNQYVKRSHPPHRCKWSASHQKLHLNLTWYQRYDRLLFYYWTKRHGFCCWIEIHNLGNTFLLPNEIIFLLPDILFSPCCHIKWSLCMGGGLLLHGAFPELIIQVKDDCNSLLAGYWQNQIFPVNRFCAGYFPEPGLQVKVH